MTEPARIRLQRSSTADQVVELLRSRIVSAQFAPGTQLREVELSREIGVSRPTLREALRSLGHDGLVRHEPHRGTYVAALTPDEVADVHQVRRVLEGSAAHACGAACPAALDAVAAAAARLDALADGSGERESEVIAADLALHRAIVALLASPRLNTLYASVTVALEPCLVTVARGARAVVTDPRSRAEHSAIAAAIAARDGDRAQRLVVDHIDANERLLLSLLGAQNS
jgi:DNA-binding GntR family transcriptional regulator